MDAHDVFWFEQDLLVDCLRQSPLSALSRKYALRRFVRIRFYIGMKIDFLYFSWNEKEVLPADAHM